jgi:hypothetical protein
MADRDAGQDFIGCLGPSGWLGLFAVGVEKLLNGGLERANGAMGTSFDLPRRKKCEPALDLVEPRGVGRPYRGAPRARLQSYFAATRSRYQRRIVSGVASEHISPPAAFVRAASLLGEQSSLGVGEPKTLAAEAGAQHPTFGA